jgi:nucleoside-diphosphate-sugar epimerase
LKTRSRVLLPAKAKRLFGYEPTRTLEEIINDVAREFSDELKSETANA